MAIVPAHKPTGPAENAGVLRWGGRARPFARTLRRSRGRTASFADVQAALRRLDGYDDPRDMFGAAAEEAARACDLTGAVVCSFHGQVMIVNSAYLRGRPDLSETLLALARDAPRLDPSLDVELPRRPAPVVVERPQSDPRVLPVLVALVPAPAVLVAPITTGTEPVGLLYGLTEDGAFDWIDRELTWTFAAGLAQLVVTERLRIQLGLQDTALRPANRTAPRPR